MDFLLSGLKRLILVFVRWDEPGANLEVICRNLTYIITARRIISGDVLK
jgi:hypothetical protein